MSAKLALLLLALVAVCGCSFDKPEPANQAQLLEEQDKTLRYVWQEWMHKPPLTITAITPETLSGCLGRWTGGWKDGIEGKMISFDLELKADGTWSSKMFRPEMKHGHWYLYKGMIQLYESPLSEKADLASAAFLKGKTFQVLDADAPGGTVLLHQDPKPR